MGQHINYYINIVQPSSSTEKRVELPVAEERVELPVAEERVELPVAEERVELPVAEKHVKLPELPITEEPSDRSVSINAVPSASIIIHPRYPTTTSMSNNQFNREIKDDEYLELYDRISKLEEKQSVTLMDDKFIDSIADIKNRLLLIEQSKDKPYQNLTLYDKKIANLHSEINIMKSDIERSLKLMHDNIERNSMVIADKTELMIQILKRNNLN